MALSRFWYVIVGVALAVSMYFGYLTIGQINRREGLAVVSELASSSQTVEWALKIDSRRRLDSMLGASVDSVVQSKLLQASTSDRIPQKSRDEVAKALAAFNDKLPSDYREDVIFAVDREGRVVAQVGDDMVIQADEVEFGGYPAVYDAIHGYLRDDTWVLGERMYFVVVRPVEFDATQRPAGAVIGLKRASQRLADDIARRTRTNVVFYANGVKPVGGVGTDGFDRARFDAVESELRKLGEDKTYGAGRSEPRALANRGLMGIFARLPGDAWHQGGGFAVVGAENKVDGLLAVANSADDKDKASVPWINLIGVAGFVVVFGLLLTVLEHTVPLRELVVQSRRLKAGTVDGLQVPRFRGTYREIAQNINSGIERVAERGGGASRKPADLESILGPVPAQPAMSAFSFPMQDGPAAPAAPTSGPLPSPISSATGPTPSVGNRPAPPAPRSAPAAFPPAPPPRPLAPPPAAAPAAPPPARPAPPPEPPSDEDDDEATTIGAVPAELLAQATGELRAMRNVDEPIEWQAVYEDFVRVKKQCGESVEGLTFEKFQSTLRKNRDALVQKHGCNRVKFTVYVKEGRASLKATPVRD